MFTYIFKIVLNFGNSNAIKSSRDYEDFKADYFAEKFG